MRANRHRLTGAVSVSAPTGSETSARGPEAGGMSAVQRAANLIRNGLSHERLPQSC